MWEEGCRSWLTAEPRCDGVVVCHGLSVPGPRWWLYEEWQICAMDRLACLASRQVVGFSKVSGMGGD